MGLLIAYLLGVISVALPIKKSDGVDPERQPACKCCHHKAPWWKVLLDVLTFLAATSAAGAAIYYAVVTKGMWKEMQTQTKTAQRQLEATERPWIQVTLSFDQPPHPASVGYAAPGLTFLGNGDGTMNMFVTVKNIGHSVASISMPRVQMYTPKLDVFLTEPFEKQRSWCDQVRGEPVNIETGRSLLPEESQTLNTTVMLKNGDIEEQIASLKTKSAFAVNQPLTGVVYGCLNYRFSFSNETHQTWFLYWLTPIIMPNGNVPIGASFHPPQLDIYKCPFGGSHAD